MNLRAICHECHLLKTQEDRAAIRLASAHGQEWAKAEVLRRLADAGLLAAPKERT